MNQAKSPQIVQQELALDVYLSKLLDDIPEANVDEEAQAGELVMLQTLEQPLLQTSTLPVVTRAEPEFQQKPLIADENQAKLQALSVMPEWAQQEFQALFFKVEHLIVATPLITLARTIKIDRQPGKIPGQPSWFLGLLDEQDSRIGVLDTGQLIFGKNRGSQRDLEQNPFKSILITQDKRWGLACDEVLSIGRLHPEKVRWRTSRPKRPWLMGTIIEELTAIIDLQALVPQRRNQK